MQKENIFQTVFHLNTKSVDCVTMNEGVVSKETVVLRQWGSSIQKFGFINGVEVKPPLISFKRDKNVGNFLVRSALKTNEQPGTFKCARSRCKTCLFIVNTSKISGPKRSVKITDRFTCTSANVIYCITCTLCNKLYIGETGRRLGDRFCEHLRDFEKNDKDASKPVARHFNLPNHFKKHMAICGLSLRLGTTESRKNLEQKFIFQIGTLNPHGINERFSFKVIPLKLFYYQTFLETWHN